MGVRAALVVVVLLAMPRTVVHARLLPHAGARFGAFVALAGDVVLVGAPGAPAGGVEGAGVVWMFDADTGRQLGTLSE